MASSQPSAVPVRRFLHPATLATLVCGLAVSILLFHVLQGSEHDRSTFEFERRMQARLAAITRSFDDAADAMRATNLLFSSGAAVTDAQYEKFAAPLIKAHPYFKGLVYFRFVDDAGRDAYEALRARQWPGFEIRERTADGGFRRAARRPLYLALDKVTPLPRDHVAHGYDIWSFAPHRALAERTIGSDDYTASGLIPLIEPRNRQGVVIALPIRGAAADAGPGGTALGLTEVVIDAAELMELNLRRANFLRHPGIELAIFGQLDGKATMAPVARFGTPLPAEPSWWGRLMGSDMLEQTLRFEVGGRDWELRGRAREPAAMHQGSVAMLLLSIAFSLAVVVYVDAAVNRARHVERLVDERTVDLKRATEAMRLYFRAIESSANAVLLVDATRPGYPVEYVNPAFERMRGTRAHDIVGQRLDELMMEAPEQPAIHELRSAMRACRPGYGSMRLLRNDGSEFFCDIYLAPVQDAAGNTEHFVINEYDVTEARTYAAQLEHLARYDTLTELPNRVMLGDRIERAAAAAARHGLPAWVVVLDLDHFKHVNDSLGHPAGDRLLRTAAARIAALVQPGDTVARTGGDEFVLLLVERAHEGHAAAVVDEVLRALAEPFEEGGQRVHVGCSAGIAGYPVDGGDPDTLLNHAEIAMYRAKEEGRNTLRFYRPGMNRRAAERRALVDEMRHGLAGEQFELHYQPQVALASGTVIGVEALIRWRHPQHGMMRPDLFIGLAEETGLIVPLGAWVLRTACRQSAAWRRAGRAGLRIAVNLSALQFRDEGLASLVAAILAETGMPGTCLEVEITESLVMENVERAIGTMVALKAMGVQLAIDDFGTGYSSLAYLKRFPVDVLKIDQSFVRDIEADAASAAMVAAIISMAHALGMRVIAEGVETERQRDFLHSHACDEVQGYLIGRPMPGAELAALLDAATAPVTVQVQARDS